MPEARRAGRWRTGQLNRQRIIDAARERFMRDGYERATVRAIAADAGVDVAMVYYFFGNKEGLFTASTLTGPEHPLHQLATLLDDGTERIGERLVRRFLEHWEEGAVFEPFLTLWRSAAIHPEARKVLHGSLAGPIAKRVAAEFGVADAELRVELVASHLAGLAFARYQLKIEPLASTPVEDLVAWLGPTVQRYLTA
ncbi:TetR family transcriptional regulator [Mycobacterium sp. 1165196.3]|uniref:TetR/AcrR family transcriptional regulator n=1 Tax=unclassified Mycobacterium TaxID=2642494 RepID=UPI0007FE008C|nr:MULTISPECIES: TetR family transcriptional regulator [unclassified Mycobacterium]OBJ08398.1 TetR family transcriptional regulator [Mycobacterium sp. 1482292.6]OBK39866.1 TetR family transcriptional regulator [Mycobacterium sp. 1165196.3]OBL04898.1 TetR family transcriptional regulator [Mycobacterium sp. 1245499.0]